MTTRAILLALAARCEAATGPDRELDAKIGASINWRPSYLPTAEWEDEIGKHCLSALVPAFTASLDTALTLVPEEWGYWIDGTAPEAGIAVCVTPIDHRDKREARADVITPALALTAAALRARAEEAPE